MRNYLIQSAGDLKRKVICVLDQVFPEYKTIFSNTFGTTSKQLLLDFSSPSDIEQIKFIDNQVKKCETKIKELMEKINFPITTIPGVCPVLSAVIISEFGDISRFDKPSKLVAYAGIDATISQSGEFEGTHTPLCQKEVHLI